MTYLSQEALLATIRAPEEYADADVVERRFESFLPVMILSLDYLIFGNRILMKLTAQTGFLSKLHVDFTKRVFINLTV